MTAGSRPDDPFAAFNFIVSVQGMEAGFAEVEGLATETSVIDYREGNEDASVHTLPSVRKYVHLTFKRGVTSSKELWEWRKKVMDGNPQRLSGTITLLDEARKPARVWKFYSAWPSKWVGPAFDATNNEVAIEEMEIAVEGLEQG